MCRKEPFNPHLFNLNVKPLCQTLSKALERSRKTALTSSYSSKHSYISVVINNSWFMAESPGLKPDCFFDRREFDVRNTYSESKRIFSKIFTHIGKREMGR